MTDNIKIKGHVSIKIEYTDGRPIETLDFDNLVVNNGLNMLVNALSGASAQLTWVAVGTSTNTPGAGDIRLNAEVYRTQVTSFSINGNVLTTVAYILPNNGNGYNLQEIGWFGAPATGTKDSGTMYAHATYNIGIKNNLQSLTITRTDTLTSS